MFDIEIKGRKCLFSNVNIIMSGRVRLRRKIEYEVHGGSLASFTRGFNNTFNKISPARLFESKHVRRAGAKTGELTHNELLPAVVTTLKPVYDTTATLLNPITMGTAKPASEQLWENYGAKYQPKQRNKQLGMLTGRISGVTSKEYKKSFK